MELQAEWLETDGLGGFASGTVSGRRTRRYHALLLVATNPPTGRVVLVNGFDAWLQTPSGTWPLSTQHYLPDVVAPDGQDRIVDFQSEPWPTWHYRTEDGTEIRQEILVPRASQAVTLRWTLLTPAEGVSIHIKPFLSGRDYHSLHRKNNSFSTDVTRKDDRIWWQPYQDMPTTCAFANGSYDHAPTWFNAFFYEREQQRGLDCVEDLVCPGELHFDLSKEPGVLILQAGWPSTDVADANETPLACWRRLASAEKQRRAKLGEPLDRAADAYIVRRTNGSTIIAGYPWFTDWGRDTFIAMRGLCIATGRLDLARDILLSWAGHVSSGMLPNRFPDKGNAPEFNSVDASLWFVIAVHDYFAAAGSAVAPMEREQLRQAVEAILEGYSKGTRHRIAMTDDGLIASGEPGVQLTWMDAKVGDWVVTPRIGKPVEIEALWLNALHIASAWNERWRPVLERGREAFTNRFWNPERSCLFDVIDVDHETGKRDPAIRPNQLFAAGGLPLGLLTKEQTASVLQVAENHLLTPMGLRTLSPVDPAHISRYEGSVWERDGAYHQGTVWPWLLGPFVEAWVRHRNATTNAKDEARRRFLEPIENHLHVAGLGHISEIADAASPYTPRGCPFQAWSLGELLRLKRSVLKPT
ncbi:Amylo-alpha-1,6-glucosidase [Planctomycetes bacterium Pan216]|uniref:Amylo-alpha-1,6-glucosidase n=1 Tax=Kolteria novifilia TaxID=2527975 RepID=A0A518B042_9BACT|nr:Amylo-alpha-1,6-glucosidase [Planctomycetes bacterium Pan216]